MACMSPVRVGGQAANPALSLLKAQKITLWHAPEAREKILGIDEVQVEECNEVGVVVGACAQKK